VLEDALNHGLLGDGADDAHSAATTGLGTGRDVKVVNPREKLVPREEAAPGRRRRWRWRGRGRLLGIERGRTVLRGRSDEARAPRRSRTEKALVSQEVLAGRGHEPGDAAQKLSGGEEPVGVAVAAALAQREGDAAVGGQGDLVVSKGGPQGVADEAVAAVAVGGLDTQVGVHFDAVHVDEAWAEDLGA